MSPVHPGQDAEKFRNEFGIPFARPGTAVDHAQTVIGVMVVCLQAERAMSCMLIYLSVDQNKYQTGSEVTVDGGWLLEMAF